MSLGSKANSCRYEQMRLAGRKQNLWLRARMIQSIRAFFMEREYLEVETPQLISVLAPEVHIEAIHAGSSYLHTSPEL